MARRGDDTPEHGRWGMLWIVVVGACLGALGETMLRLATRLMGRPTAALADEPLIGPVDLWERWFALDGGFVRMADNQLIVLAERAVAAESFTLAEAEAELKSAATRQVLDPAETEQRRRDVDLAKLKVRLAREKRGI